MGRLRVQKKIFGMKLDCGKKYAKLDLIVGTNILDEIGLWVQISILSEIGLWEYKKSE